MTHLASLTQENSLDRILEKIETLKTINGKWVALSNTPAPVAAPGLDGPQYLTLEFLCQLYVTYVIPQVQLVATQTPVVKSF